MNEISKIQRIWFLKEFRECVLFFFKCNSIADHNFQITTFDLKIFKLNAQTCLHIRRNVKLQYTEYNRRSVNHYHFHYLHNHT